MAPNGIHWRCTISHAGNVASERLGFGRRSEGLIAHYTSGQGARYFDWPDGGKLDGAAMARPLPRDIPAIAEHGAGRDWPYAGWLTDVLGYAEHGRFVAFWPIIRSTRKS